MSQPYVGEIRMFAGNFAPNGWMFCSGQLLPISEWETLFNLIGTTYGGDGQSTFALPNLQSRLPMHMGTGGGGTYQIGESAGVEEVTLTNSQIPQHNHGVPIVSGAGNASTPANNTILSSEGPQPNSANVYVAFGTANQVTLAPNTIGNSGGNQPHSNIQPILVINFVISMFGIFPSQN